MRSELKLVVAGFGAGVVVGAIALTSVGASITYPKLPAFGGTMTNNLGMIGSLNPGAVVTQVALPGAQGPVLEYRDAAGQVVYRSDPAASTTVVVKGVAIPSRTVDVPEPASMGPKIMDRLP